MEIKRGVGDIWKDRTGYGKLKWKLMTKKGIISFLTKKEAVGHWEKIKNVTKI